ncbi:hypothetical protein [Vibrio algivorus]|uniref:Uncharacterized protein n=1 Tax=Vibrio algivorus TaxID=1667024 RepID=A0A557PGZ7_9VIBR|nr:hypothetical protein [Vibrio algivorus]TVO39925.1 hypothetical protein FOF44_00200 [Vibrio algivorus]
MKKIIPLLGLIMLSPSTFANSVNLGTSSSGFLANIGNFFQELVISSAALAPFLWCLFPLPLGSLCGQPSQNSLAAL